MKKLTLMVARVRGERGVREGKGREGRERGEEWGNFKELFLSSILVGCGNTALGLFTSPYLATVSGGFVYIAVLKETKDEQMAIDCYFVYYCLLPSFLPSLRCNAYTYCLLRNYIQKNNQCNI